MNATTETQVTEAEETRYAELQRIALDAARHGDADVLLPMLTAGLPVNLSDEKGNSLLMLASYHGHADLVCELLDRGADPDQRNDRNQTPLAGVAFKGELAIAKLLVDHGADVHADQGGGRYPVQFAAMFGHPEMVAYLSSLEESPRSTSGLKIMVGITGVVRKAVMLLRGKKWVPSVVP